MCHSSPAYTENAKTSKSSRAHGVLTTVTSRGAQHQQNAPLVTTPAAERETAPATPTSPPTAQGSGTAAGGALAAVLRPRSSGGRARRIGAPPRRDDGGGAVGGYRAGARPGAAWWRLRLRWRR
eukprot:5980634-Prymnesium_polylepis.1